MRQMNILCNGRQQELSDNTSLLDLLRELRLPPDTVVAEVNRRIIEPDQYGELQLQDGDRVELIRFVGGG